MLTYILLFELFFGIDSVEHFSAGVVTNATQPRISLDTKIDSQFDGVTKHLGQIAMSMDTWEGQVADQLCLTTANVAQIKKKHPEELQLQA